MKVLYCDYDGGNELFEEEREDIPNLLAILNSNSGKIMIQYDEDQYFYGSLQECCLETLLDEDTEERYEILKLFFAKEMRKITIRGNIFPSRYYEKQDE